MVYDRHVPLDGGSNMRDLGGLPLKGGGNVRRGVVYRSAGLHELTPGDGEKLVSLGIRSVVDLRSERERTFAPSRLPDSLLVVAPGDGNAGMVPGHRRRPDPVTEADARRMMREGNRTYPERLAAAVSATFSAIAETEGALLFHCTAGKDRTGFVAATILLSAGVDREAVVEDYLMTNEIWDRKSAPAMSRLPLAARDAVFSARAEYLEAALEAMEKAHGSLQDYLDARCGISETTIRQVTARLQSA